MVNQKIFSIKASDNLNEPVGLSMRWADEKGSFVPSPIDDGFFLNGVSSRVERIFL